MFPSIEYESKRNSEEITLSSTPLRKESRIPSPTPLQQSSSSSLQDRSIVHLTAEEPEELSPADLQYAIRIYQDHSNIISSSLLFMNRGKFDPNTKCALYALRGGAHLFSLSSVAQSDEYRNKEFHKMSIDPSCIPRFFSFIERGVPTLSIKPHLFFFLYHALFIKQISAATNIITQHPDLLNMQDSEGNTPLHWICSPKFPPLSEIKSFISQNHISTKNHAGKSPLLLATEKGDPKILSQLLGHEKVISDLPNKYLATLCLIFPQLASQVDATKLQKGKEEIKDFRNYENWDSEWLKILFSHITVEELCQPYFYEFFQFALENERFEQITLIIQSLKDSNLETLLLRLARSKQWSSVEWLLKQYPQLWTVVNQRGENILFFAIDHQNLPFIEKCVADPRGKELFAQESDFHESSLDYLLRYFPDWVEGIHFFSQIKVKIKQKYLVQALEDNLKAGNLPAIKELLKLAAEERRNGTLQVFPLHIAVRENCCELIQDLMLLGEDQEAVDQEGHTPLHLAAKIGNLLAVNSLSTTYELMNIKDKEGKIPFALAVENHQFHVLYPLLKETRIVAYLHEMERELPGKVLYRAGPAGPYRMIQKPTAEWLPFILNKEPFQWIILIPFMFHDVDFAHKLFKHMNDESFARSMQYLREEFPSALSEWLETERQLFKLGLKINPEIYRRIPSVQIPQAPADVDFAHASQTLLKMIARIQDKDPHKPGYTKKRVAEIQDQLNTFIADIERETFAENMTGKKGSPECAQFYQSLKNIVIQIAIFLSKEGKPGLPLLDDDYCASVLGELAKSTKVCATGRANSLFMAYNLLNDKIQGSSSFSSGSRLWEIDLLLHLNRYREQVVQWVIGMQREPDGGEILIGDEVHIGLQVRSLLKERGVPENNLNKMDIHKRRHITEKTVQGSFDQFFSMSGLLQMMEEGINGLRAPDGRYVIKPVFDSGKMLDWLRDNCCTPQELERQGLYNELVAAIEQKQKVRAKALAEKLGVPGIMDNKSLAQARDEVQLLADELRLRIVKDYHFNEETNEWGKMGIVKMLMHPKIGILKKRNRQRKKKVEG